MSIFDWEKSRWIDIFTNGRPWNNSHAWPKGQIQGLIVIFSAFWGYDIQSLLCKFLSVRVKEGIAVVISCLWGTFRKHIIVHLLYSLSSGWWLKARHFYFVSMYAYSLQIIWYAGMEMAQLICGGCRTLLMHARGAASVRCSCCHTVNLVPGMTLNQLI